MIVIDASALVAFFLREEGWKTLAPYMKYTLSVDHVVKEFYNAVWRAVCIKKLIDNTSAKNIVQLFREYTEKNLVLEPEERYIDKAFDIATEYSITIYDSLYIAQALSKRVPLRTLDEKQCSTALRLGITVLP